jgi:hypothetical protein
MGVPVRALCVATACAAIAGVAGAPAQAREPFDVFTAFWSTPFVKNEPYVRTRPGGSIRFNWVDIGNRGPGRAPATTVGFRWKETGAIVETASVGAIDGHGSRKSGPARVPLPARNGRYHLWVCANTPRVDAPERRYHDNCNRLLRPVIVRRPAPVLLDVAPTSWNFGSVASGSSSEAQNFTVRNLGPGYTGPGSVVIAGAGSDAFEIGSNGCTPGLRGTSACRIRVTFTPPTPGSYSVELVVTFQRSELRVPLTGAGG